MADTYTTNGKVRKIEQGAYPYAWADVLNEVIEQHDDMIAGTEVINLGVSTSYSLPALANGTDAVSRAMALVFTGTPASPVTVTVPASVTSKLYLIKNDCGQSITFKYTATAGVVVAESERAFVYADGTTVYTVATVTNALIGQSLSSLVRTASEIAAGITPVNYGYKPGHVKRYGSALNSATLQAALNANAGNVVFLAGGETHTITTAITWPLNTHIRVDGDGTAILDASAASLSGSGHLVSTGTIGSSLGGGLASSVNSGAFSATLNSAPSLNPGDLLILRNPTDSSWNAGSGSYRQGEFLTVKSVSGAVVTFTSAVIDTYSSSVCTLHKVTPTSSSLVGDIEWRGNTADTANVPSIFIKYGQGNIIDGVKFRRATATCLEFSDCYNFRARIDTGKYLTDAGSIQASGVIAGGQKGYIFDSVLHGDRHGASTGGGGTVVSRYVVFARCAISSRTASAADFHASAEFCEYRSCHIDGGINLSGARNRLIDNYIYPHASVTSLINLEGVKALDFVIEGNTFYLRGSVVRYVIDANDTTDINSSTIERGILRFISNRVIDTTALDQSYFFIRNNGSAASLQIEIISNTFTKTDTTKYGNVFSVSVVSGSDFGKITYLKNTHEGTGFGTCSGVSRFDVDRLGEGPAGSSSPTFGTTTFEPCEISFQKTISLATAGTAFTIFDPTSGNSFVPTMLAGRVDANTTATSGQYLAVGVNAANRRTDFGVFGTAASSSQHAKNSKMRFINSSELTNQAVVAGEVLALLSVDGTGDNAGIGANVGGSAGMTVTLQVAGRIVGNMPSLP